MGLEVENDHASVGPVGYKSPTGPRRDGNSVVVFLPRNIRNDFAGCRVKYLGMCDSRDVEQMMFGIDSQIVPAAFAARMEDLGHPVVALGILGLGAGRKQVSNGGQGKKQEREGRFHRPKYIRSSMTGR